MSASDRLAFMRDLDVRIKERAAELALDKFGVPFDDLLPFEQEGFYSRAMAEMRERLLNEDADRATIVAEEKKRRDALHEERTRKLESDPEYPGWLDSL